LQTALANAGSAEETIAEFAQQPADTPPLAGQREKIDRIFSLSSVEQILQALEREDDEWSTQTRATILTKSPISTKVAFRQLREGAELDFNACMKMEYRLANRFIEGRDFYEGVRATVIDKGKAPQWSPDSLAGVTAADVDAYFAPLGTRELVL